MFEGIVVPSVVQGCKASFLNFVWKSCVGCEGFANLCKVDSLTE